MDSKNRKIEIKKNRLSMSDIANLCSTVVAISALLFSSFQYLAGIKRESKINRPIISVFQSSFSYDSLPSLKFVPTQIIQNLGARPAYDCKFSVITIKKRVLTNKYSYVDNMIWSSANPMIPGVQNDLNSSPILVEDSTEYFFKIKFEYKDIIPDLIYSDSLYFGWSYRKNENSKRAFQVMGLQIEEAKRIDNFLGNN